MERLTERTEFGIVGNNGRVTNYPLYKVADDDPLDHNIVGQCFNKLADYEDAEEDGLLLQLPCKVGDKVYNLIPRIKKANNFQENEITVIKIYKDSVYIFFKNGLAKDIKQIGKTVFLTQEEAEQALKRLESEQK